MDLVGQAISSEKSSQSLTPSHLQFIFVHLPLPHLNSSELHVLLAVWKNKLKLHNVFKIWQKRKKAHTAISRKVVGKSARDNPERYCGWFWIHYSSKKFERMAWEAMDLCVCELLKESNKRKFDSCSVRNGVLIISHIALRNCRVHIFSDDLSRNSCIRKCGSESGT